MTGTLGEERAVELLKQGAWDYVTKEHLGRLEVAVKRALKDVADSRDRNELRQREQAAIIALRESGERFRALVQNSADIILTVDENATILYGSPASKTILGIDPADALGANAFDLVHPDDRDNLVTMFRETLERSGPHAGQEFRARRADGTFVAIETVANNLLDDPAVRAVVINARDVTERQRAERLLRTETRLLDEIAGGAPLEHSVNAIAREMEGHVSDLPCLVILTGESAPDRRHGKPPATRGTTRARPALDRSGLSMVGVGDERRSRRWRPRCRIPSRRSAEVRSRLQCLLGRGDPLLNRMAAR